MPSPSRTEASSAQFNRIPEPLRLKTWPTQLTRKNQAHYHDRDELWLIDDDGTAVTWNGLPMRPVPAGTLLALPRGTAHAYDNRGRYRPTFWILHLDHERYLPHLKKQRVFDDDAVRLYYLSQRHIRRYHEFFLNIMREVHTDSPLTLSACDHWIELLLIDILRRDEDAFPLPPAPTTADPSVLHLWSAICNELHLPISRIARRHHINYDSMRHRFRAATGRSPREVQAAMRMEKARHLLLATTLSIKEIAPRIGYRRQHEFSRAFAAATGLPPSVWRTTYR